MPTQDAQDAKARRIGRELNAIARTARAAAEADCVIRSLRAAGVPMRGLVVYPPGYSREAVEAIARRQAPFLAAARAAERAFPRPVPGTFRTIGPTIDETNPAITSER